MPCSNNPPSAAFPTLFSIIQLILLELCPDPVAPHWEYTNSIWRIKETLGFLENKEEYFKRQELIIYYNLGVDLYQASRHFATHFLDPDHGDTLTGCFYKDMKKMAVESFRIPNYHANIAIRLFKMFYDHQSIFKRLTGVDARMIHNLKDSEVDALTHIM